MNEYQKMAARTINQGLTREEQLHHALHGMSSEVGEIHGIYQKHYQGHEIDPVEVQKELGDLMWFVAELCTAMGWQLADIANQNIAKLVLRYPQGFEAERSLHREE